MATATMTRPGTGSRVWRGDGQAATVTEIGQLGVYAVPDGERLPVILSLLTWRLALACEYCEHPAEWQLRDGQDGDVLCRCCARSQFDRPADWVRPITPAVIRRLYPGCPELA